MRKILYIVLDGLSDGETGYKGLWVSHPVCFLHVCNERRR